MYAYGVPHDAFQRAPTLESRYVCAWKNERGDGGGCQASAECVCPAGLSGSSVDRCWIGGRPARGGWNQRVGVGSWAPSPRFCDPIFFWGPNRATPSAHFSPANFQQQVKSALAPLLQRPTYIFGNPAFPPKIRREFFLPNSLFISAHSTAPWPHSTLTERPPAPHITASSSAPINHRLTCLNSLNNKT